MTGTAISDLAPEKNRLRLEENDEVVTCAKSALGETVRVVVAADKMSTH